MPDMGLLSVINYDPPPPAPLFALMRFQEMMLLLHLAVSSSNSDHSLTGICCSLPLRGDGIDLEMCVMDKCVSKSINRVHV